MAILTPYPEDGTGYVNATKVGSKPEWYVAIAIDRLGWDFEAQVSYFGGRKVAGGMVLDYLVYTLPDPTPIFVQGEHWHSGSRQELDALQLANLRRFFSNRIRDPILLEERTINTPERAYNTCKREIGKAS
jgi:hypothetical protein